MKSQFASLRVLALLGAGAALAPQAAFAQTQATESQIENADVDDGPVIIVTAQGRAQVLADVPVAVSAVSGETLQNSGTSDIVN